MQKSDFYIAKINSLSYKNFKEIENITFEKEDGEIYPWTIFIGNNGTGKTNLLKILSCFESVEHNTQHGKSDHNSELLYFPVSINEIHKLDLIIKSKSSGVLEWGSQIHHESDDKASWSKGTPQNFDLKIYAYGVNRKSARKSKLSSENSYSNNETLFDHNISLINLEEWLLQTDYAVKNGQKIARRRLNLIKKVITGDIFPEIKDFRFHTDENLNNSVEFLTNEGWFEFDDLAYGYQSTLSWIIDFSKKMFDRYPYSENPLKESAIVLIDEIDLHLHPEWQRNITSILSKIFPKTQFIATTHSPLVVQSLKEANVYLLVKEGKNVSINRVPNKTFKGWSVEDILYKVMGLESRVKSDEYLSLIDQFDDGLDRADFARSKKAYDKLMEILPENDSQKRILQMQIKQFPQAR
jgi:predicted ATP-binding protein involved in virulence